MGTLGSYFDASPFSPLSLNNSPDYWKCDPIGFRHMKVALDFVFRMVKISSLYSVPIKSYLKNSRMCSMWNGMYNTYGIWLFSNRRCYNLLIWWSYTLQLVTCTHQVSSKTNDAKAKNWSTLSNSTFCNLMSTILETFWFV